MQKKSVNKKRRQLIKRVITYAGMVLSVFIIVTFIVFFLLGYRFDSNNGRIEQYALLQFNSVPAGATVKVDGKIISSQTPNKTTVSAGKHVISMAKTGYETWTKNIEIKSGILDWLNYALLVPKKLTVESVASYETMNSSLASSDGHYMLIQPKTDSSTFDLVDLSADTVKTTKITIPAEAITDSTTVGVTHTFQIINWDDSNRYVLIKHSYGDKYEWLDLDTQDTKSTKNITKLFDFAISDIRFTGTTGNVFFALGSGDIRKLDLSAGTISRPLISKVISFGVYDSNVITYVAAGDTDAGQKVVGLFRDGDDKSYVLKTIQDGNDAVVNVASAQYFNEDYVAISVGKQVDIFGGSYPSSAATINSLKLLTTQTLSDNIQNLSFSPTGEYVLTQSGADFSSYDLEYQLLASSSVAGGGVTSPFRWLNDNYVWSDNNGRLTVREFDGENVHTINAMTVGQSAVLTDNGRYIYSINNTTTGYQLQRVRMILP
jgi:hypothetical protein